MTRRRPTVVRLAGVLCVGLVTTGIAVGAAAQTVDLVLVSSIHGPADLVEVQDGRAYVTAERTLTVFDISDAANPKRGGAYTFPEKIWGLQVDGSLIYAAVDFFGLGILDVSDIAAPALRGSVKTPGQAKGVAVFGSKALVADHMEGVDLVDLSDLTEPVVMGSFYLDGYSRDVTAAGSLAYAVDSPTGLYVFDFSSPDPLEPVTTVQSARTPRSVEVPAASGGEIPDIVCMVGGGFLQVYDVSNPAEPVKTADFRTPSGRPLRVTVRGRLAYVADGPAGLQVVDLTTPSEPTLVGTYPVESRARDVAVTDSHVFVVVGEGEGDEEGEVLILRLTIHD